MDTPRIIALTDGEIDTLHGIGSLGFHLYVLLRTFADYRSGTVGRTRPISLAMLAAYSETHTRRGGGMQITQPSEKEVRTALDRLTRAGLLRRLSGDRLSFLLPLALTASSRPAQTRHGGGAEVSTERGTGNPAPELARQAEPGTAADTGPGANRAHIMNHENQTLTRRPVDNTERHRRPPADCSAEGDEREHARLIRIGRQRGIEARPGESWHEFAARLFARDRVAAGARG